MTVDLSAATDFMATLAFSVGFLDAVAELRAIDVLRRNGRTTP